MSLSALLVSFLVGTVNLYHPHSGNSALNTLVVTLIILGFIAVIAGAATFSRRRETRREAQARRAEQRL